MINISNLMEITSSAVKDEEKRLLDLIKDKDSQIEKLIKDNRNLDYWIGFWGCLISSQVWILNDDYVIIAFVWLVLAITNAILYFKNNF